MDEGSEGWETREERTGECKVGRSGEAMEEKIRRHGDQSKLKGKVFIFNSARGGRSRGLRVPHVSFYSKLVSVSE